MPRVINLIALLLVAGAATQGYLPGVVGEPRQPTAASPAETIILAVLLAVSVGAVAIATVSRLRHPRAAAGSMGQLAESPLGGRGRLSWRVLLIALAAVALALVAIVVFAELGGMHRFSIPVELPDSRSGVPASPSAPGTPVPPAPPSAPGPDGSVAGLLLFSAVATVLLAALVTARPRRGRVRPSATDGAPVVVPGPAADETLVRVAELGLTRIADRSRGPREAIIACYAAMERHLADVPDVAPRQCDTPTEVLARAVDHHALASDNASRLVELFTEARFSPHQMTEQDRADAVAILRLVLDELRAAT
ncbi:DUF4129 domain-containing protein [Mycolicibacter sp. MYC123]|uniref:DUF4129 domain-containing protein n=1 Tax=[Mycobacterium] zoologicum TaxID=2872311 RepID=A0ABU5YJM1_9MYCO|nr:DUF4129 domain-containing protein [Mycolicibacter sp. MYC123]MEB3050233.1 DUF4129 domain-containing protein [Mycolicibacter sp. MYC123]